MARLPKLDRRVQFDERSRNFPVTAVIDKTQLKSHHWTVKGWLDQGQEGACVGFGWSHLLISAPGQEPGITDTTARKLYKLAQSLDEWAPAPHEGSSVIAGAKAVQSEEYIGEYRWAFGLDQTLLALSHVGPVVLGVNWYEGMDNPDDKGVVKVTGNVRGGHCLLASGIDVKNKLVRLHNSWGKTWALNGECFVSFDDLGKLLADDGEACIPVHKKLIK